jgi:serine/threonine protein kinase
MEEYSAFRRGASCWEVLSQPSLHFLVAVKPDYWQSSKPFRSYERRAYAGSLNLLGSFTIEMSKDRAALSCRLLENPCIGWSTSTSLRSNGTAVFIISLATILTEHRQSFIDILDSIHAAGYLHTDIRTPNLMIHDDGSVNIVDFDRAEEDDSEDSRKGERKDLLHALSEHKSNVKRALKKKGGTGAP